jgi:hypothetical protein
LKQNLQMTLGGYEGRCTDQGGGVGGAVIEGSGTGGFTDGEGKGSTVIGGSESGGGMTASEMSSCREVSQLDDDVFPLSTCWTTLLLATTAALFLERMASVPVFTCFREGSGGVGISVELAAGEASTA